MVRIASIARGRLADRLLAFVSAGIMGLSLAACGGGGGKDGSGTQPPPSAGAAPTIVVQPRDQNVVEGTAATFTVVAGGVGPLTYQWSASTDGATYTDIAGGTGASYTIPASTLAQSGIRYRVVVGNAGGSVSSSGVTLIVTAAPVAPAIAVQPADVTVPLGSAAVFNVTATGSTPAYVWQVSTDGGATFGAVPLAPSAPTLTVASTTTAHNGYRYRVQLLNSAGTVTSRSAILSIAGVGLSPAITSQPGSTSVVVGQMAVFLAAATGTPAPTLQWRLNGADLSDGTLASGPCSGAVVSGATTTFLTLLPVPLSCNGALVSVVASNGTLPNATSDNAVLTVTSAAAPLAITLQPASQSVVTDDTATFMASASGTAVTYQWQRNGVNIVGATNPFYITPPVTWSDSGALYSVVVSNASGSLTSAAARLDLMLSANQQIFESLSLSPGAGSYLFRWNLNFSGPETPGVNFAASEFSTLPVSPLTNGTQNVVQTAPVNLTTTLPLVPVPPQRFLKNGVVLVVPGSQNQTRATYVGSDVRVDYLAADNATVAYSHIRTSYSQVALTGPMPGSTDDFAHYHNSFFSNAAILKAGSTYLPGSAYIKYLAYEKGDRFNAFDCIATTTDANVSPCATGITLAAALTVGISSTSDGRTYFLADGAIRTVGGVQVWVATTPRPLSASNLSLTPQYRIYYALNGNVYTGSYIPDGSPFTSSYYVSNPGGATIADRLTFLPFNIRMNKAARDSVAAAMAL